LLQEPAVLRLILEAWAEINPQVNQRKMATIDLETGKLLAYQDSACFIP
jgi:hypothetical protein